MMVYFRHAALEPASPARALSVCPSVRRSSLEPPPVHLRPLRVGSRVRYPVPPILVLRPPSSTSNHNPLDPALPASRTTPPQSPCPSNASISATWTCSTSSTRTLRSSPKPRTSGYPSRSRTSRDCRSSSSFTQVRLYILDQQRKALQLLIRNVRSRLQRDGLASADRRPTTDLAFQRHGDGHEIQRLDARGSANRAYAREFGRMRDRVVGEFGDVLLRLERGLMPEFLRTRWTFRPIAYMAKAFTERILRRGSRSSDEKKCRR